MAKAKEVKIDLDELMKGKTRCTYCGKISVDSNFYISNSRLNNYNKRQTLCKDCLTKLYVEYLEETQDVRISLYKICRSLDIYYTNQLFESSYAEAGWNEGFTLVQNGLEVWKKFIKTVNSLKNYKGLTFDNGEQIDLYNNSDDNNEISVKYNKKEMSESEIEKLLIYKQNKEDIIKIVGYDPFINEKDDDKPYMYARLVDMLDESMQEDSMKLTSVISIIKTQRQIDKLDDVISELMSNPLQIAQKSGDIKSLTATKKDLQKSVLDTAKDNRISELYSGTKTTGANTLSGTLKKLKELQLNEVQVNLYDIQTSLGMQQVANLSNKAIVEQLMFAENEYADMVAWQRGKVQYYEKVYKTLIEENRKLKYLLNEHNVDYKQEVCMVDTEYKDVLEYNKDTENQIKLKQEELNDIVKNILPMNAIEYAEKVIHDNEVAEKEKLLNEING